MNTSTAASVEVEQPIDANLPAFDGHFPGAPVLPGAHLLALVLQVIARHAALAQRVGDAPIVQQVKFLAAVGPGQALRIRIDDNGAALAFSVHCGTTLVARGQVAPHHAVRTA